MGKVASHKYDDQIGQHLEMGSVSANTARKDYVNCASSMLSAARTTIESYSDATSKTDVSPVRGYTKTQAQQYAVTATTAQNKHFTALAKKYQSIARRVKVNLGPPNATSPVVHKTSNLNQNTT